MIFPYRADVSLGRWPVFTVIVCAICIWVFVRQEVSARAHEAALTHYCNHEITRDERLLLRYLEPAPQHYCDVLLQIRAAPDRAAAIGQLAASARQTPFYRERVDSEHYMYSALLKSSQRFDRAIPFNLTERLQYDPSNLDVRRMITAAFSHGGWWHLISNLIFFFAFAASVEAIAGYVYFVGFTLASAIGTHLAYRYSMMGVEEAIPTVGLSGVVMAMMSFLATIMPGLRIRTFLWFFVIVRVLRVPALALAAIYIVQDIADYLHRDPESNINYVAHLGGAAIGVALGILYRFTHRQFLGELRRQA